MINLPSSLYYFGFALTIFIILVALVPREEIKRYFWFSLIWGSGVDFSLIVLFRILNIFRYEKAFPLEFLGAPIFVVISWAGAMIIFFYFLPKNKVRYAFPAYLTGFSLIGVCIGEFFLNVGLIKEIFWDESLRAPVIWVWFYLVKRHHDKLQEFDPNSF